MDNLQYSRPIDVHRISEYPEVQQVISYLLLGRFLGSEHVITTPGELIAGPAIIEEWNSTVVVQPHQQLRVDEYGNLHITRELDR